VKAKVWVHGWLEDYTEQATGEFTGLPAGIYAVLVEDAEDCPSYTTEYIVLNPADWLLKLPTITLVVKALTME
jgi:hypothetical protein